MRNKNIIVGLLIVLFFGGWLFSFYLLDQNQQLKDEIFERNSLLQETRKRDSALNVTTKKYSDTINKYVNNCEVTIDGKKIPLDGLLTILNNSYNDNNKLTDTVIFLKTLLNSQLKSLNSYKSELNSLSDSLEIYKTIWTLAQQRYDLGYLVSKNNKVTTYRIFPNGVDSEFINKRIVELVKRDYGIIYDVEANKTLGTYYFKRNSSVADSALMFRLILNMIKNAYGVNYQISSDKENTYYHIEAPTLDSSLVLFPYFKHMLTESKDKKQWVIDISGKKIREARHVKSN